MKSKFKKPIRFFEKSGVVNPEISYYVPLKVKDIDNKDLKTMVDLGRYFSIFAPRQSGKTTFFRRFSESLEHDKTYIAILLSFQDCKDLNEKQFYNYIENKIYKELLKRLKNIQCDKLGIVTKLCKNHRIRDHVSFKALFIKINEIIEFKKIVIFIDEFDGIPVRVLENFLCTLRELYQDYKEIKQKALYSIGLVGIRNITKLTVGGVSPFNIADKINLPGFNMQNINDLYSQYTEETNQAFTKEATKKVYEETKGQPWLVNRIGAILTVKVKPETIDPLTLEDVNVAIDILLREHNSHFDNLAEKAKQYKETFIEIVFNGVKYKPDDEAQSLLGLHGLIKERDGKAVISNNIYQKRFVNMFFNAIEDAVEVSNSRYYHANGMINMESILSDFEEYIMAIGVNAFYDKGKPYEKTGQFLLTAWLYQFIAGTEGDLRYECPTGLGRMDILLTHRGRKYIIETKINRGNYKKTLDQALEQIIDKYIKTEQVGEGYIVIFDPITQVGNASELQKIIVPGGKQVVVCNIAIGNQ